jgi:uncharacterized repeat protein (TIGR01451 family)
MVPGEGDRRRNEAAGLRRALSCVCALAVLAPATAVVGSLQAQTATVSTMAELRSAINNNSITTININPGTYLLTSSGSGQLEVERDLTIQNTGGGRVVIDANDASRVFNINSSTVTLRGLTITRGNGDGGGEGGAVYANSSTLRLIQSTLSGNATSSSKQGGAVYGNSSSVEVINSTISGNSASGSQGGGIYVNGGSILVTNSTIASNTAGSNGGGIYRGGPLTLRNSIVADNTGGQIAGSGTITSNGKNVVEGGCSGCSGSDLTGDPSLAALADNGGDSYTHALLSGSLALDAGSNTDALATDQRGRSRPQGATADIGAYESGTDLSMTKTVSDSTPSEGSAISYTVTVSGAGPDGATSVAITDVLPSGVTFESSGATQGTYDAGTGVWTVGTVASGGSATLTLNVTVDSGTTGSAITNTASVLSLDQAESSTGNNSASVTIDVQVVISVTVTPDGGQALGRLPSNGTDYTMTFTVENTGGGAESFDLLASSAGVAVTIVSVSGVAGDSARITGLAAGTSQGVDVVYSVADVPAGSTDTLDLRARSVSDPTVDDLGFADVTVVRPNLALAKSVSPVGTSSPGTELTYALAFTNVGSESAVSVVHVDSLPTEVEFKVGSVAASLPSGMGVTVAYSDDGGSSWSYTPASGGCGAPAGYDRCVSRIRWTLQDDLSPTAPDNSGELRFIARIR